jgi:uncharacterized membrane protein
MAKKVVKSKKKSVKTKQGTSKKLDKIISTENKLLQIEKEVEQKEDKLTAEEGKVESEEENFEKKEENFEKKEETDIEKLEKIEEEIKEETGDHPLANVTFKDLAKGLIGAFIGLAIHYTFVYGVEIAKDLTMTRATIMFPLTFLVGLLFIYATGFRKIKDTKILIYMPMRLLVLYVCALVMSILVLFLFYPNFGHSLEESYKMVSAVMLAAVVGACTADLIGKE